MPTIKLALGQMDLSGDPSSPDDTVTAHLYNGYRHNNAIKSVPGLAEWCDLGTGNAPIDGDYYSSLHDMRLVISNGRAWRITKDGGSVELQGAVLSKGVPVSFTEDSESVYFCADSLINKYTNSTTVTQITGQAPINCRSLAYISGFLVAAGDDSTGGAVPGDVWFSDNENYTEWEVFNSEAVPDAVQSVFVTYSELYAIGRESVEVNYLSGDVNNPFASNKAASQPFGTPSPNSVAFDKQSIYYITVIGGNRKVVRLVGGRNPEIISFPVDAPINDIADISAARAWIQSLGEQTFYVVTFPSANIVIGDMYQQSLTLAFSLKYQEWYIWGGWFDQSGQYRRYPADTFAFVEPWGKGFIGYNGKIYELGGNSFPDSILRPAIRTGWRTWGLASRQKVSRKYSYDIKRGEAPGGSVFQHRWRNDGELEWKPPREMSLGNIGQRKVPKESYRCGMYYKRQDEFIFPAGTEMVLNGIEEEWDALR